MQDFARQARLILAVYRDRGRAALQSLAAKRYDEANELLRLRTAAFHNFRAADLEATVEGTDLSHDPEALAIWDEIRKDDRELHEALQVAHTRTAELIQKLREARRTISSYRSGEPEIARFEKTA